MTIKINLLLRQENGCFRFRGFKLLGPIFLLAVGIILLSWHLVLQRKTTVAVKQRNYLQQELNKMTAKVVDDAKLKERQQADNKTTIFVTNLEQQRSNFVRIFTALHQGVARDLYFTRLVIKGGEVRMTGQTRVISSLVWLVTKLAESQYGGRAPLVQKIVRLGEGYSFVLLWIYK
jgi:Tfp pilus assembly protein PilN